MQRCKKLIIKNNIKLKNIITQTDVINNNNLKIKPEKIEKYWNKLIKNLELDLTNMKSYTLIEVVRSKLTNVVNLCNNIRDWIDNTIKAPKINSYVGNGVYIYKKTPDKLDSEWFKKYLDYIVSLADSSTKRVALRT